VTARRNPQLAAFLRTRRAQLGPDGAGLPPGPGGRRVPGLRREEIAMLAGVSPDYYTRLEQGRQPTASPSVLDALARALRLSAEERKHLYTLAGHAPPSSSAPASAAGPLHQRALSVVEALGDTPAIAVGPFLDIVAANAAARFLFEDFYRLPPQERNTVRWVLLSPRARELYQDQWETTASDLIGMLRVDVGRRPADRRGKEIVGELLEASPFFRRLWTEHKVSAWQSDEQVIHHPTAGLVHLNNAAVSVTGVPDLTIFVKRPADQAAFVAALRRAEVPEARAAETSESPRSRSESSVHG
jgi:transcriptional regulator with XRE-family HTH domain